MTAGCPGGPPRQAWRGRRGCPVTFRNPPAPSPLSTRHAGGIPLPRHRLPRAVLGQEGPRDDLARLRHRGAMQARPGRRELLRELAELLLGGWAGVEEPVLELNMAADGGPRLRERLVDPADDLAGGARRLDHHDPLPGQQLVQQLGGDRLRELVIGRDLPAELPVGGQGGIDLLALLLRQPDEAPERGGLKRRRAEQEPQAQRQEDRNDGHEVIAKVDHRGSEQSGQPVLRPRPTGC